MAEFCSLVQQNLIDLINRTSMTTELCIHLLSNNLVTKSQYEHLRKLVIDKEETNAAEYLYVSIIGNTCDRATIRKFGQTLHDTMNFEASRILFPEESSITTVSIYQGHPVNHLQNLYNDKSLYDIIVKIHDGSQTGSFEGLYYNDEQMANYLLRNHYDNDKLGWKLIKLNGELELGSFTAEGFAGFVAKIYACQQENRLWWNPNKIKLPTFYIPRRLCGESVHNWKIRHIMTNRLMELVDSTFVTIDFCLRLETLILVTSSELEQLRQYASRSANMRAATYLYTQITKKFTPQDWMRFLEGLRESGNKKAYKILSSELIDTREIPLSDVIDSTDPLVLLVDPPGMGKTSAITKIEAELRRILLGPRLVLRLNLNSVEKLLITYKDLDSFDLSIFLSNCFQNVPLTSSVQTVMKFDGSFVILLDGFDEVCPKYERIMLRIVESLLGFIELGFDYSLRPKLQPLSNTRGSKLFLSTRTHLKTVVQNHFGVKGVALSLLTDDEQAWFLSKYMVSRPEIEAQVLLNSLPASVRSLISNPLMLHLLCQLLSSTDKTNLAGINTYELYEKFVEEKHKRYLTDKERLDMGRQYGEMHLRTVLNYNIDFYYYLAVEELFPEKPKQLPQAGKKPTEEDITRLLSYGLLSQKVSNTIKFEHKSFAEFFYARIFLDDQVSIGQKSILFGNLYNFKNSGHLEYVEEFLSTALEKYGYTGEESKAKFLINKGWLADKTSYLKVFENFLKGKLFRLIGIPVLQHCVDLDDKNLMQVLMRVSADIKNLSLLNWLSSFKRTELRQILFCDQSNMPVDAFRLVTCLLFVDPCCLEESLEDHEISNALSVADNIFEVETIDLSNWQNWKRTLYSRTSIHEIKEAMQRDSSVWSNLPSQNSSWWIAEIMTEKELLFSMEEKKKKIASITFANLSLLEDIWGGSLVKSLYKSWCLFAVSKKQCISASLKQIFEKVPSEIFDGFENNSFKSDSQMFKPGLSQMNVLEHLEIISTKLFQHNLPELSEEVRKLLVEYTSIILELHPVYWLERLPYLLFYSCERPKIQARYLVFDGFNYDEIFCLSLLLAIAIDNSDDTYHYVRQFFITGILPKVEENSCSSVLFSAGIDDLRRVLKYISVSKPCPSLLVHKMSYGEVIISLHTFLNIHVEDNALITAITDYLLKSDLTEVSTMYHLIPRMSETVKFHFLLQLLMETRNERRSVNSIRHKRLRDLLIFLLHDTEKSLEWISSKPIRIVIETIVEINLASEFDSYPRKTPYIRKILTFLSKLLNSSQETKKISPKKLLINFPSFRTEGEWEVTLQTLEFIPVSQLDSKHDPKETTDLERVYKTAGLPLLRVWKRHFGITKTLEVAQEELLFYSVGNSGESALLAIELESLDFLQIVSWPSILKWRDEESRSLLNIAKNKWASGHKIIDFLAERFMFPFATDEEIQCK